MVNTCRKQKSKEKDIQSNHKTKSIVSEQDASIVLMKDNLNKHTNQCFPISTEN